MFRKRQQIPQRHLPMRMTMGPIPQKEHMGFRMVQELSSLSTNGVTMMGRLLPLASPLREHLVRQVRASILRHPRQAYHRPPQAQAFRLRLHHRYLALVPLRLAHRLLRVALV